VFSNIDKSLNLSLNIVLVYTVSESSSCSYIFSQVTNSI